MILPLIQAIANKLQSHDPELEILSLTSLPVWAPTQEELDLLSDSLSYSPIVRWLELSLDTATETFDLSFLESTRALQQLTVNVVASEKALLSVLKAVSGNQTLERLKLVWSGRFQPSEEVLSDLLVSLKEIPCVHLTGLRLGVLNTMDTVEWRDVSLEFCDLTHAQSMEWVPECACSLVQLKLSNCEISAEAFQGMSAGPNPIQFLDLSKTALNEPKCEPLCQLLDSSPSLVALSLADNPDLGDGGLAAICETVSHRIQRLDLSKCSLRSGLDTLVESYPFLEALNLSENAISDYTPLAGASDLKELSLEAMVGGTVGNFATLLETWNTDSSDFSLQCLNLSGNALDQEALVALGCFPCLALMLACCQLDDDRLADLLSSSLASSGRRFEWEELNLSGNQIGDDGARILAKQSGKFPWLRALSLGGNRIGAKGIQALVDAGLPQRLEFVDVANQAQGGNDEVEVPLAEHAWMESMEELNHQLQLNRAGMSLIASPDLTKDAFVGVLSEAQRVYGMNATYHFLRQRPEMMGH